MKNNKSNLEAIQKAIEIAGGANNFALKVEVSYNTVLNWKNGRNSVPPIKCISIEKLTDGKVKREDILPDYPWGNLNVEDKKDEKLEIAKKMLGMGMSKENISEATGLSIEEIEKLED